MAVVSVPAHASPKPLFLNMARVFAAFDISKALGDQGREMELLVTYEY